MNVLKYISSWKYRYFLKKLDGVNKMYEDMLFKRFKTLEIREEIRQEYSMQQTRLEVIETQIKAQKDKPTMTEEETKTLNEQKTLVENDINRFREQMKSLDIEVQGSKPTEEYHEGIQGINQQLDALRELQGMVKGYLKTF